MSKGFVPFAEGPKRQKQVLSLGFFRTGSHSLKAALEILGLQDVFHTAVIATQPPKWNMFERAADDNIVCLPTYTGRTWDRTAWDEYFGPCEALTDVTPFAESLINAYPEAKVILVKRDFDSWERSFLSTLLLPSSASWLSRASGNYFEPLLGLRISQTLWKLYMGLFGVSRLDKAGQRDIMRAGYERHYRAVKQMVPPHKLLELDLKDLDWKPICEFLDKPIPEQPFPHLNESRVFQDEFKRLHRMASMGATAIFVGSAAVVGLAAWAVAVFSKR